MRQIQIVAPKLLHADLMAALGRIGGMVQRISTDTSNITVHAEVGSDQIQTFEAWLLEVSAGEGRLVWNRPIDEPDA